MIEYCVAVREYVSTTSHNVYYGNSSKGATKASSKIPSVAPRSFSINRLSHFGQVTERTARRWQRADRVSKAYAPIVGLKSTGDLGFIDPAWSGFSVGKGQLWTDDNANLGWTPGHIRAMPLVYELIRAQRVEIHRLRSWIERWRADHVLNSDERRRKDANKSKVSNKRKAS